MHPALLAGLPGFGLVCLRGDRARGARWLAAVLLCLVVAVGPEPGWGLSESLFTSPLAWIQWAVPGAGRMHHPLRAALVLVPLLAVGVALLLQRLPPRLGAIPVVLAFFSRGPVEEAVPFGVEPLPPGMATVAWLADAPAGAVVDLTGARMRRSDCNLYTGGPCSRIETTVPASPRRRPRPTVSGSGWTPGWRESSPGLAEDLARAGNSGTCSSSTVAAAVDRTAVEAALGTEVGPGVYTLPSSRWVACTS